MPERTAEPLSPELILVSPPEEAALAREQLPDPPQTRRREVRRTMEVPQAVPIEVPSAVPVEAPSEVPSEAAPADPADATWNEFLADVRSRPVDPVAVARPRPRTPAPIGRKGRRRLLVAAVALVAVGAIVGLGWARDRAQQKPGSSAAAERSNHAKTTTAPAVTTAPKSSKSSPSHGAGFVPTRVWSWAAAQGTRAYVVRFLHDGHRVLKIRTNAPRLVLPSRFSFTPGRYRWTVTAVPRNGKSGHVIVNSSFTVGASNG